MIRSKLSKSVLLSALTLTAGAGALSPLQAGTTSKATVETVVEEKLAKSAISGDIGVAFVSEYVLRGLVYENQGAIAQPWFNLYLDVYEGDGFVNKVTLGIGFWASLQSKKTDAMPGTTVPYWYEFDYTPSIAITFAKNWTFTTTYLAYTSPNGGFKTFGGLNFQLDFDDTDYLGAFALHPHVTFMRELTNKAGSGDTQGNYYEVGIAPSLPSLGPVSFSVPVIAGFGSHQFYADNTGFGYLSAGLNASVALSFIPEAYGSWTLSGNVTYYYLNGSLATYNVPNVRSAGHNLWVFGGSLSLAF